MPQAISFKNILVLHKRSAFESYRKTQRTLTGKLNNKILRREFKHLKEAHEDHYQTLHQVLKILDFSKLNYKKYRRGQRINYDVFDFVITIGGDGTFLEAARHLDRQVILGVNSSPRYSVGRYCQATRANFFSIFKKIQKRQIKIRYLNRLRIKFKENHRTLDALNDILVCHRNPAAMSRYYLKIDNRLEKQRGSGLWISTATGSSGAILSARGRKIFGFKKSLQYQPRELHAFKGRGYDLTGGILSHKTKIMITSLMHQGIIYTDGEHVYAPFPYGTEISITHSPKPIKTVTL